MHHAKGTFDEIRQELDLDAAAIVTAEKTGEPVDGLEIEAEEQGGDVIWSATPVGEELTELEALADYRGLSEAVAERIGQVTSVDSVEELVDLADHGPLTEYDGIGEKTEYYILQALSGLGADIDGVRLQELYEEVRDELDEPESEESDKPDAGEGEEEETPLPRQVYSILNDELGDSVRVVEDRNANEGLVLAVHSNKSVVDPDEGDKDLYVAGTDYYETPTVETDDPTAAAQAILDWSEGKRTRVCDADGCEEPYVVDLADEETHPGYCGECLEGDFDRYDASQEEPAEPEHPLDESPINGRTANGLTDAGFHGAEDALNLIEGAEDRDAAVDALKEVNGVGEKGASEVVVWLEELGLWNPDGGAETYPDWVRKPDDARQHILARQAVDAAETDGAVPRTDGMDTEVKNDLQAWLRERNEGLEPDDHEIRCPHCGELFAKVPADDDGPEDGAQAKCVADPDDDVFGDCGETFWITREDEGFATHTSDPSDMCDSDDTPEQNGGEGQIEIEEGTPAADALEALDTSDDDRLRAERPDARKIAVQLVGELERPATYQSHDDHSILLEVGEDLPVTVKRLTHDEIEGRVFRILVAESRTIGSSKPKTIVPDAVEMIESHFEDLDGEPDTEDPTDIRDSEGMTESGEGDGKTDPDAESGKAESKSDEAEESDDLWADAPDEDPDRWQGEPLDVPKTDRPHPLLTSCRSVGVYEHGSEQWDETRAKGVGSSDVGAILGLSEHAEPEDIWKAKVPGEEPGHKPWLSEYATFGTWFESYIREAAEERHGLEIIPGEDLGTLESAGWARARANIDGLDISTRGGVIEEVKTTSEQWDRVPRDYFAQVQHQMMVCGLREARVRQYVAPMPRDLVPSLLDEIRAEMLAPEDADRLLSDWLLEKGDLETWIVERDDEWIERMLAREREFWGYVEREEPPPDVDPEGAVDLSDDPDIVAALEAFARRKHRLAEALQTDEGQDLEDLADEAKTQAREAIEEQVALMDGEPKRVMVGDHKATRTESYGTEYWRLYPDTDAVEEW